MVPPRYAPRLPLPARAFRPGHGDPRPALPLPAQDTALALSAPPLAVLGDLTNADLETFRYGVDLYHAGFCWEAHEAWEALWRRMPRRGAPAALLQGLILLAAARLKADRPRGRRSLALRAHARLLAARQRLTEPRPLGLALADVLAGLESWLGALEGGDARSAVPPLLWLELGGPAP